MDFKIDFDRVIENLGEYLHKGTEAGLDNVNSMTGGNFESRFETAFVAAIRGLRNAETPEFRAKVGSIDAVSIPVRVT
jgi:hypothetical protein